MTTIDTGDTVGERSPALAHQHIDTFLQGWNGVAALLVNRQLTVLSASALAATLFPTLMPGRNLVREVFLNTPAVGTEECAQDVSPQLVALLQGSVGGNNTAELRHIVGELSARSREFSTAWAHGEEPVHPNGNLRVQHPAVGWLSLRYQLLPLSTEVDGTLIIWQATDPASAAALEQLAAPPRRLSSEV